jgi:hypothetical protein
MKLWQNAIKKFKSEMNRRSTAPGKDMDDYIFCDIASLCFQVVTQAEFNDG